MNQARIKFKRILVQVLTYIVKIYNFYQRILTNHWEREKFCDISTDLLYNTAVWLPFGNAKNFDFQQSELAWKRSYKPFKSRAGAQIASLSMIFFCMRWDFWFYYLHYYTFHAKWSDETYFWYLKCVIEFNSFNLFETNCVSWNSK